MSGKLAVCLWLDGTAEETARFYCDLFPDSEIRDIHRAPADNPGSEAGAVMLVAFSLMGQDMTALNGGGNTGFTDAVSFQVHTDTQEETDRYWDALVADGGAEMACSWCRDRFGMRWQIVPRVLMQALGHPDAAVRGRVFAAMQQMVKIDHAAIEAAIAGE
ncbi:VOC family protein [Aurantiacibacter hainanensis]|uniref:VOC family protein n=1 Tax=Aurantiacibacter hainanensis TaxID=3076114 RepID=UPI0030C6704F